MYLSDLHLRRPGMQESILVRVSTLLHVPVGGAYALGAASPIASVPLLLVSDE